MPDYSADSEFAAFVTDAEPRLRRGLCAAFGIARGREAALDALSWGWENWSRLRLMDNPVGYLYRVGQSRALDDLRRSEQVRPVDVGAVTSGGSTDESSVELLDLPAGLTQLSDQQRTAVVLVHGYGMTLRETAELMDVSIGTVRTHCDRALSRLRRAMEVL